MMRRSVFSAVCILTLAGVPALRAVVPEPSFQSYQAIPERNLFGLKPVQQQTITNQPLQLPKIVLSGITTILDTKRALLKVELPAGQPANRSRENLSLILTEGQREGDIEVLQIDEKAGTVKVKNSGTLMLLSFEKDGAKLPNSPVPPGMPPLPGFAPPGGPGMNPPALPGSAPGASPTGAQPLPHVRFRRGPAGAPTAAGAAASPAGTASGSDSAGILAAGTASAPSAATTGQPQVTSPNQAAPLSQPDELTPEEQQIVTKLQQEAMMQDNTNPNQPPNPQLPGYQPQTGAATGAPAVAPGTPNPQSWPPILPQ